MSEKTVILVTILGVVTMMLLLLGGIAVILFLHQKKIRKFFSQLEDVKAKNLQELLHAQLEVQEQTLSHISREIHDSIGQSISLAKLYITTIPPSSDHKTSKKVEDAIALLTKTMDDLRGLSNSLTLQELRDQGLAKAIESQLVYLRRTETYQIHFDISGNYRYLDDQREIILFRIFQEATNNIIRHAQATEIWIELDYQSTSVSLKVADNGIGFIRDTTALNRSLPTKSRGLANMKERAAMIHADFKMNTEPGKGTTILVTVPLNL